MAAILAPFALMWIFVRELIDLFKIPKYRATLYWLALLLLVGTVFYNRIEGWSILDSFYFSVVTLATVGYGDFAPTTSISRLFTAVYIFMGLSFFVSFASLLAKERQLIFQDRRTEKHRADVADGENTDQEDQ